MTMIHTTLRCLVFYITFQVALAGFEHTCVYEQMYGRRGDISPVQQSNARCGLRLSSFIAYRCGGNINLRGRRSVMLSKEEANTYLRVKRSGSDWEPQSLTCECCINGCTVYELDEYCGDKKRRRRSIKEHIMGSPPTPYFTQEDVDEVYREINEENEKGEPLVITSADLANMALLEENKLKNIERKKANDLIMNGGSTVEYKTDNSSSDVKDKTSADDRQSLTERSSTFAERISGKTHKVRHGKKHHHRDRD